MSVCAGFGKAHWCLAMPVIGYMEVYVDDDGFWIENSFRSPKTSYKELREGEKPVRQWMKELKEALGIPEGPEDHRSF